MEGPLGWVHSWVDFLVDRQQKLWNMHLDCYLLHFKHVIVSCFPRLHVEFAKNTRKSACEKSLDFALFPNTPFRICCYLLYLRHADPGKLCPRSPTVFSCRCGPITWRREHFLVDFHIDRCCAHLTCILTAIYHTSRMSSLVHVVADARRTIAAM